VKFARKWILKRAWLLFTGLDDILAEKLKIIRERSKLFTFKVYARGCLNALNEYRLSV